MKMKLYDVKMEGYEMILTIVMLKERIRDLKASGLDFTLEKEYLLKLELIYFQ